MPLYEYQCQACEEVFEVRASIKEKEAGLVLVCPKCGSQNAPAADRRTDVAQRQGIACRSWSQLWSRMLRLQRPPCASAQPV